MSEFGDLKKLKVPELKAALKERGLQVTGKKEVKLKLRGRMFETLDNLSV
jgi:hypothetical protein